MQPAGTRPKVDSRAGCWEKCSGEVAPRSCLVARSFEYLTIVTKCRRITLSRRLVTRTASVFMHN
jgi:hypothetical protein